MDNLCTRERIPSPACSATFCKVEWLVEYLGACQEDLVKQETEMPHKKKSQALPSRTNGLAKEKDAKGFAVTINNSVM